jgi:hypothetical protein
VWGDGRRSEGDEPVAPPQTMAFLKWLKALSQFTVFHQDLR